MTTKKTTKIERGRDAGTGQFIPLDEGRRRKKTAIVETVEKPKKPKKP